MRLFSFILVALACASSVHAATVTYTACDGSSANQTASWTSHDNAVSSVFSYKVCAPRPQDLRFAYDMHLTAFDGKEKIFERILPVCRMSTTDCADQLATTGCISGEFVLRLPAISDDDVHSTVTLNEFSVGQASLTLMHLCSN